MSGASTDLPFYRNNPPPPPPVEQPLSGKYREQQKAALVVFKEEWEEKYPLHAACRAGELGVVQSILEHTDPRLRSRSANLKDNDEWTPLHYAAWYNNISTVEFLLRNSASMETANLNGSTPLHFASGCGNVEIVNIFLKAGTNLNIVDGDGMTALAVCQSLKPKRWEEVARLLSE